MQCKKFVGTLTRIIKKHSVGAALPADICYQLSAFSGNYTDRATRQVAAGDDGLPNRHVCLFMPYCTQAQLTVQHLHDATDLPSQLTRIDCIACPIVITVTGLTSCIQNGPEKNAQSLMYRHFATVCSSVMRFSPKCSEINW